MTSKYMTMAITETQYKDMKPYWDFQRLQEYNKEMIKDKVTQMIKMLSEKLECKEDDFDDQAIFDTLWSETTQEDWLQPIPFGWRPKDPNLLLWYEI